MSIADSGFDGSKNREPLDAFDFNGESSIPVGEWRVRDSHNDRCELANFVKPLSKDDFRHSTYMDYRKGLATFFSAAHGIWEPSRASRILCEILTNSSRAYVHNEIKERRYYQLDP